MNFHVIQNSEILVATATTLKRLFDKCVSHENLIKQIHAQSITCGLFAQSHQSFACKLLNVYAKLNKPFDAHKVFDQIPQTDIVSWTCLLSLHLQLQQPTKAFSLFTRLVVSTSLKPDSHSIVAALSACARTQDLLNGKTVHAMAYKFLSRPEPIVGNALIDMYSRTERINLARCVFDSMPVKDVASWTSLLNGFVISGAIESAWKLFEEMSHRNAISWTIMIVGCVRAKEPVGALELFKRMRKEGDDSPTTITIVAVLSGCADIGALDFGKLIHGYVNKVAGFAVDIGVNNALIDMYAKSGNLDLATKIFRGMIKKDAFTWTSIILGLALHGRGTNALEFFDEMLESGVTANEITYLSVLSACSHAGLVNEGKELFNRLKNDSSCSTKIEHYGCMVDLLGRAGHIDEAARLIHQMPMKPDAVIWRSLLTACVANRNLELAEMAAEKALELEPHDDGVYVLLWNLYSSGNMLEDASRTVKMMRDQRIKKKPGCSWVEINGILHEFVAEASKQHVYDGIYWVLDTILKQSNLDFFTVTAEM
ncbi:PREDICTED: pentatricopeptide repeat-containing protein At2g22410, mitochondrial-like [Nicotiana attenuata]|uniref:Pentatricopeptide repeat-containing protein, mitochondrial n=1 Tax=Nicotiana attenuata TaxID=49451 RepID=A0A314KJ42_NICAT|nr:PREDICTED: pentatricopeptide repeat-containing protein At2g22410, mitochondrial-like [Nicotiana attenuata]OIT29240.1 pentatricopeptide repeat-containing protein, mitochondrial [Nicotiana attenuata]